MWRARYRSLTDGEEYWRTVWADQVNEATKKADRMAKKGFRCVSVTLEINY